MPKFVSTATYSVSTVKGLMQAPTGCRAAISAIVEAAGGKLIDMFMTTGPSDVMIITEMPHAAEEVSLAMVFAAAGVGENIHTVQAWSPEEIEAIASKATSIAPAYSPPGA